VGFRRNCVGRGAAIWKDWKALGAVRGRKLAILLRVRETIEQLRRNEAVEKFEIFRHETSFGRRLSNLVTTSSALYQLSLPSSTSPVNIYNFLDEHLEGQDKISRCVPESLQIV